MVGVEATEVRPGAECPLEDGCAVFEFSSASRHDLLLNRSSCFSLDNWMAFLLDVLDE